MLIILIVSYPANPVAEPLPSTCYEADAVGRLPIAASLPIGVSVSKHFRDLHQERFERNVKQKAEWADVIDDPAFVEIQSDCDAISVSELVDRRNEMLALVESDDEAEGSEYYSEPLEHENEHPCDLHEYSNAKSVLLANDRKQVNAPSCLKEGLDLLRDHQLANELYDLDQNSGETEHQRLAREQEERLAALGVTGFAKPVQPSVRRTVATTEPPANNATTDAKSPSHSNRSTSTEHRLAILMGETD